MSESETPTVEFDDLPDSAFIRQRDLMTVFPFSESQLWRLIRLKQFPPPISLSARVTVWKVRDVRRWLASRQGYTGANPKRQKSAA